MFKTCGLPCRRVKKILSTTLAMTILATVSVLFSAASVEKTVNIYADDNVTILNTKAATVSEALDEANISLASMDTVVPEGTTEIYNGMDIRVYRTVNVGIVVDDTVMTRILSASSVGEALKKAGVNVGAYDVVTPDISSEIFHGMIITVKKAIPLKITIHGIEYEISTQAKTVGDLIASMGIVLADNDRVNVPLGDMIKRGMNIEVVAYGQNYVDVIEDLPYGTDIKYTSELETGQSRKISDGVAGEQVVTYLVHYENGYEVSRELTGVMVTKQPVNEVCEYGTAGAVLTSRGEYIRAVKTIKVTATAYDLSYESCGKNPGDEGYGITASGMQAQYGVIAVDTDVIPLGTRLYVEAADGSWTYGYCVAGDTGGYIDGNRIDLFYNSREEAINFGRREAIVYVLE